ncbi:MAG: hypothetical protein MI725_09255 [Pirellulales bacterium]|nr:hypothetical protein [Pirellulales bacterium]
MIRRIIKCRYLAIALLVVAQLSITLHAVEHGVGQHAHSGVPCLYGATNDDDVLAPPPSAASTQPVTYSAAYPAAGPIAEVSETGVRLPPATGPPAFS